MSSRAGGPAPGSRLADRLTALSVSLLAFAVYLATLFPGLMGSGDTAKFQYLGRVLGTAHNPGYPLYVFVSHAFSYLPIGSLAFRMNLLSAVLAASTVGVTYLVARALGCRPLTAVGGALVLGWGRVFWSQALRAEVYTLGALLLAGSILALVRWAHERRPRQFFAATICLALALGNHLTIVMVVPGLVLYALLTDARFVTRPGTLAIVALILIAGLAQYGFIVVRTLQGAPFVESRAASVGELVDVIRGVQFADRLFTFDAGTLIHERVPHVARIMRAEWTLFGVLVLTAGLARLRAREAVLILGGSIGVLLFALNYDVPDLAVFLIAVFVLCAPAVGAGLETLSRGAERLGVVRAAAGLVAAVSLPAVVIAANYRVNDHHRRTYEIEYFDAFFGELPARAAIVSEEYAVDQMMHYKLAGEGAAGERDIRVVNRDRQGLSDLASRGYALYAFGKAQKELAPFGFDFTPVALGSPNRSIDMRPLPLFLLRAITPCADIGNLGWTDITPTAHAGRGRLVVRIDNYRQFEAEVLVYALTPTRAAVRMLAPTGGRPSFDARVFAPDAGAERQAMARILQADGVALSGAEGRFVSRTLVRVNDMGQAATFMLDLGAHPATVMTRARVDLDNPRRASVCPDALSGAEFFRDPGETRRTVPLGPQGRAYLVAGWHEPERPSEYFRWTSAPDATLLVPLVDPEEIRVVLEAAPFDYPGRPRDAGIALSVNGHLLPRHPLPPGRQPYTWIVPARAWMTGLNEVVIRGPQGRTPAGSGVNEDTRELGLAVYSIVLATTGS